MIHENDLAVLVEKLQSKVAKLETKNMELQAALHVNYLRDHPELSHDEIVNSIEKLAENSSLKSYAAAVLKLAAVELKQVNERFSDAAKELQAMADKQIRMIQK